MSTPISAQAETERWVREEVEARLSVTMRRAFENVTKMADQKDVSLRVAAYAIALKRIVAALTPAPPAAVIVR